MKKVTALALVLAMCLSMTGCFAVLKAVADTSEEAYAETEQALQEAEQEITEAVEQIEEAAEVVETVDASGLRPEFKAAMDTYESFMDEYCAFMEKYMANPTDLSLLSDYAAYMNDYTDAMAKFDAWESEDLNAEELDYYLEVSLRVSQKLIDSAQ